MAGLRALVESDLAETLEDPNEWGLPVELIAPDGTIYNTSANDATKSLYGMVLYDTIAQDENGMDIVDHNPVVTLRRSSLTRVPVNGEAWAVRIPTTPLTGASLTTFALERAMEGGGSIGVVRLYLRSAEQS